MMIKIKKSFIMVFQNNLKLITILLVNTDDDVSDDVSE